MPATVICAVTSDEPEIEATVRLAADLAERQSATLAVVDIDAPVTPLTVPPGPGVPPAALELEPEMERRVQQDAARRRAELEGLARGTGHETVVVESLTAPAQRALRELSARPDAELMVVHDQGGGALRSLLADDAGRQAMRDVHCPVVLSPPGRGGPLPPDPTLLCGIDDDDLAPTVAAFAGHLAATLGVAIHFVHAGDADAFAERRLDRLAARCRVVLPRDVVATFSTIPGSPGAGLRAEAEAIAADLVIVGRPAHGALASAITGSVAHALLHDGPAPVAVVPDAVHLARA